MQRERCSPRRPQHVKGNNRKIAAQKAQKAQEGSNRKERKERKKENDNEQDGQSTHAS